MLDISALVRRRRFFAGGAAPVLPWTPADMDADLALWLDADDSDTITVVSGDADISDATLTNTYIKPANVDGSYGLFFKPDGTKAYVCEDAGSTGNVIELVLSTPWDITTAIFSDSVSAPYTDVRDCHFKPDGTMLFVCGENTKNIAEYSLSTAWDISTATFNRSVALPTPSNDYTGLSFKDDGTAIFVTDRFTGNVYEFSLATAWDISTVAYAAVYELNTSSYSYYGLAFSSDGSRMYSGLPQFDRVEEYSLSTPWSVSTASLTTILSTAAFTGSPTSVFMRADSSKVYISDTGRIFELDIPVSQTVSQWDDKSPKGRNFTQPTASIQPAYLSTGLGEKPSVYFDTATKFIAASTASDWTFLHEAGGSAIFLVIQLQPLGTTAPRYILITRSSPTGILHGIRDLSSGAFPLGTLFENGSTTLPYSPAPAASTPVNETHIIEWEHGLARTNDFGIYVDGVEKANVNYTTAPVGGFTADAPLRFGSAQMYAGEMVVLDVLPSTEDRQKMEGYLAWKWGGI